MWGGWTLCLVDSSSVHSRFLCCDIIALSSFEFLRDGWSWLTGYIYLLAFPHKLWILQMPTNWRNLRRTNSKWFIFSGSVPISNNPKCTTAHRFLSLSTMHRKWDHIFLASPFAPHGICSRGIHRAHWMWSRSRKTHGYKLKNGKVFDTTNSRRENWPRLLYDEGTTISSQHSRPATLKRRQTCQPRTVSSEPTKSTHHQALRCILY
jgi:hypothetical protein